MKSIAGSIVVLGACGLLAAVAASPDHVIGNGPQFSHDLRSFSVVVASALIIFGLIVTFLGTRDGK